MIKNEKQFRIAKAQARRWPAQRDAAKSQLQELQEQIHAYEWLDVEDLPRP